MSGGILCCRGGNRLIPPHGLVGATRRVRNVHQDDIIGAKILSLITERVGTNVSATRVSGLMCSCAISRKTVPTPLGCRKFPGDIYASIGRIIYRNVPDRSRVLRRKSVVGMSISAVLSKCCSSTSHVFVVNGAAPRGRGLIQIAGRYLRVNVRTTGPFNFINSVNGTVRHRTRGGKCSIIHSLYNRNIKLRFRRRPRIYRFKQGKAKVLLIPNVMFAVRPVVGVKA